MKNVERRNIQADFFWISGAIGIAFTNVILTILLTDPDFLLPPTNNIIVSFVTVPILFFVIPVFAIFVVSRLLLYLNLVETQIYFRNTVISFAVVAIFMRYYFLNTQTKLDSPLLLCVIILISFLVVWRLNFIFKIFQFLAFLSFGSVIYFLYITFPITDEIPSNVTFSGSKESMPTVVHIIFDELSMPILKNNNDKIDSDLFPNFSEFSDNAVWYPNVTTGESSTPINVLSQVSGMDLFALTKKEPFPKKIPTIYAALSKHVPVQVSEPSGVIKNSGGLIQTDFQNENSWLKYIENILLIYSFGMFPDDWVETSSIDLLAEMANASGGMKKLGRENIRLSYLSRLEHFIDRIDESKANFFYSYFPHHPYFLGPNGKAIKIMGRAPLHRSFHVLDKDNNSSTYRNVGRSYINQIRLADNVLGKIMTALKKQDKFSDALIIVSSDHGIGFTSGSSGRDNSKNRTEGNYKTSNLLNASMLLMVKYPQQNEGNVILSYVRPQDVAPTVVDVLNLRPNWKMDGVSLVSETIPKNRNYFRPTEFRKGHAGLVKIEAPYEFNFRQIWNDDRSHFLVDHKVGMLKLIDESGGKLLTLSLECSLPKDIWGDQILTLDGYSMILERQFIGKVVLIAVNGLIATSATPSQYFGIKKGLSDKGLFNTKWTAELPPQFLQVGMNSVTAYSAANESASEWAKVAGEFRLTLSEEEHALLSTRSKTQACGKLY